MRQAVLISGNRVLFYMDNTVGAKRGLNSRAELCGKWVAHLSGRRRVRCALPLRLDLGNQRGDFENSFCKSTSVYNLVQRKRCAERGARNVGECS